MRTDGELLEREESSGLIDPSEKVFFALERRALGADQSEHNDFTFRHKAQWLEGAGTLVVVFEEEAIDGQFVEETFGDDVVASFRVPVTAIVAAAEMDGERDAGRSGGGEAGIVAVERGGKHLRGIDAQFLLHPRDPLGIEVVAVARRIDLQVGDATGGESADVLSHDGGDGLEHGIGIFVDRVGDAVFERDRRKLRCAGQGDFDGPRRVLFEERKLASGKGLALLQSRGNNALDAAHGCSGGLLLFVIVLPFALHGVAKVESFDGVSEVAHEIGAPQLAVSEDVKPNFFLALEDTQDLLVFDGFEFRRSNVRGARADQVLRAKQAADMVGTKGRWHMQVLS